MDRYYTWSLGDGCNSSVLIIWTASSKTLFVENWYGYGKESVEGRCVSNQGGKNSASDGRLHPVIQSKGWVSIDCNVVVSLPAKNESAFGQQTDQPRPWGPRDASLQIPNGILWGSILRQTGARCRLRTVWYMFLGDGFKVYSFRLRSLKLVPYRFSAHRTEESSAIRVRPADRPTQTVRSKSRVIAKSVRYTLRHHLKTNGSPLQTANSLIDVPRGRF